MEGLRAACQAPAVTKTQFVGIQITGKLDDLNVAQKAKKQSPTPITKQRPSQERYAGRQILLNLSSTPYYLQLPKQNQSNNQIIEYQQDIPLYRLPTDGNYIGEM